MQKVYRKTWRVLEERILRGLPVLAISVTVYGSNADQEMNLKSDRLWVCVYACSAALNVVFWLSRVVSAPA